MPTAAMAAAVVTVPSPAADRHADPPDPMRLYNTLTRREEEFAPSRGNTVRMYTCGLTVYARGHIGNFRTFVALDVLRRALKYQAGYDDAARHELHRRRRPDHRRVAEGRRAAARIHRAATSTPFARTPRRWASSRSRRRRARPTREHRGDGRA